MYQLVLAHDVFFKCPIGNQKLQILEGPSNSTKELDTFRL